MTEKMIGPDGRINLRDRVVVVGLCLVIAAAVDVPSMIWGGMPPWAAITVLAATLVGGIIGCL